MGFNNLNRFFNTALILSALIFTALIISISSCKRNESRLFVHELDSIKTAWVPDLREGILKAELTRKGQEITLKGETDLPGAKAAIISLLENSNLEFVDSLVVLPDTTLVARPWGLVTVSVCNLRAEPSYSAEMVSQALMGTPVKILKKSGGWFLIQTPDKYLGWTDSDVISTLNNKEHNSWKSSARIFYTNKTGDIFAGPEKRRVISDIVAGCILVLEGEKNAIYDVMLPDGRRGFIPKEDCIMLDDLTTGTNLIPDRLVSLAESFMGIPYLWGGTSAKGFDCSGFVKTVYFLNGLILPRDASQQFLSGSPLNKTAYPDSLEKGDLLFFGSVRDGIPKPTHVAMYTGNGEFIHASGMVKVNSLDSTRSNFSRYRFNSFLGVRRINGFTGKGVTPIPGHHWYK